MSAVSGGGSCEVATSVICLNVSQFALRKFHRFVAYMRLVPRDMVKRSAMVDVVIVGTCPASPRKNAGVHSMSMGECKVRVGV